jgi:hypothetical protein
MVLEKYSPRAVGEPLWCLWLLVDRASVGRAAIALEMNMDLPLLSSSTIGFVMRPMLGVPWESGRA